MSYLCVSSNMPAFLNVCDFGDKFKILRSGVKKSEQMSKVHFVLSYSSSLLSLIVHSADSTFTIDQMDVCPALLTLPACVLSLVINLELPSAWPAVRVGGTILNCKSLL